MSEKIDLAEWKHVAEDAQRAVASKGWCNSDLAEQALFIAMSSPARVMALIEALEVAHSALQEVADRQVPGDWRRYNVLGALARIAALLGGGQP